MEKQIVEYDITNAAIEKMKAEYLPLTVQGIDDKAGFEMVHQARMEVKNHRVAVEKKIPLVIQGENPELIFGLKGNVDGGNALTIKNNNTIEGCKADDLIITKEEAKFYECMEVTRKQLDMFEFPSDEELKGIKGIFLQYYAKEWGQVHNTFFARSRGLKGRYEENPVDMGRSARETSVDGDHLLTNQYLKYLKFGFGYETDWQCYLIREIGASREEAFESIKRLDSGCHPRYIKAFCDYINISMEEFYLVVDKFVNKDLFYFDRKKGWTAKFKAGENFNV